MVKDKFPSAEQISKIPIDRDFNNCLSAVEDEIKKARMSGRSSTLFLDSTMSIGKRTALREFLQEKGFTTEDTNNKDVNGFYIKGW